MRKIRSVPLTLLLGTTALAPVAGSETLTLSAPLRVLLQAEMREIAAGVQTITLALATAEWQAAEAAAIQIRDAYLGHEKFPQAQREEMQRVLPAGFRAIDASFHERADRLARAAAARDGELAAYHLFRLNETCIACHSQYVSYRFTGFPAAQADKREHRH